MNAIIKIRNAALACLAVLATVLAMVLAMAAPCPTAALADGSPNAAAVPTMRSQANAVQRSASRATHQALDVGKTATFTVKTPERFHEMGLAGVSAGDTLTATNLGQGKWRIANPSTGESVVYTQKQ